MKFKRKPGPKDGDKRTVKKFAFFPVAINNITVWLEFYNSEQVYYYRRDGRFSIHEWIEFRRTLPGKTNTPSVKVRFYSKYTDFTCDGTVIEETEHSYLVTPDDSPKGTARWNKECCVIVETIN